MQAFVSTIAQKIKKIRKSKGRTIEEMASRFNMKPYHWRKFEMGITKPDADLLIKIARFFNVHVEYFLKPDAHCPLTDNELLEMMGRAGSVLIETNLESELEGYYATRQRESCQNQERVF